MGKPEVWDSLPTFEMSPGKTFFGLDKSGGHCFTLQKDMTDLMIRFFGLREGKLQQKITLVIDDRDYPAIVRWARIDRSRPHKLKPEDLPVRDVVQFDWRSHEITQAAVRIALQGAFEQISSGKKNSAQSALFVHIRDDVFCLYPQRK
tara:strand:- start:154 stop:597 length:444 start_codon:yes stop_codon:yes gene_type:complete